MITITSSPPEFSYQPEPAESAGLEAKWARRLAFISELSKHIGEDLNSLLYFIAHSIGEVCDLEMCTIFLLNEKKAELYARASNAFPPEELKKFKVPALDENGNIVIDANEPFICPDAPHDQRLMSEYVHKFQIKSLLTVPLKVRGKFLGVIHFVNSKNYHHFVPEEVEFITALATEVALAIEAAELEEERRAHTEESEKAKQISVVYEAAKVISAPADLDTILAETAKQMCNLAGVNRCFIFLLDEIRKILSTAYVHGAGPEEREFFSALAIPLSHLEGWIWGELQSGKPQILNEQELNEETSGLKNLFELFGTQTCLIAPLISKEKLIGFLFLEEAGATHSFAEFSVGSVMALTIYAATSIERAQLYKQVEDQAKQVHTLYQISTALSASLNLNRLFHLIIEKAIQLVHTEKICLFMWEADRKAFVPKASQGLSEELLNKAFLKLDDHLLGLAGSKKKPVYSPNILLETQDPQLAKLFKKEGLGAVLAVPLVTKRQTIGIITIFSEIGRSFHQKETYLLGNFASHAALCIENALLYNQNKQKLQELGILFDVGKRINQHLNPQDVLKTMADQFVWVTKSDGCSIMILDRDENAFTLQITRGISRNAELQKKVKTGYGIIGKAAKTKRPWVLTDEKDGQEFAFPKSLRDEGIKTILSAPLATKAKILGILNLYSKHKREYSPSEMHLIETLAAQGSVALQNAQVFEEHYHVAQLIQKNLLPELVPVMENVEIGVQYLPSQEISGDYYDFLELGGNKIGVTIADVAGKGTNAAIFTGQAKYAWKAYALLESDPQKVLTLLNRVMVQNTPTEKFISLFYGVLDVKRKEFIYSNAGHFPPLLYRAASKQCRRLNIPGLLLGVEEKAEFTKRSINLHPNDILLFFTDGVTEARNEARQIFGMRRLEKLLIENADHSAQVIANRILTALRKYTRRRAPEDDITVLVLKVS